MGATSGQLNLFLSGYCHPWALDESSVQIAFGEKVSVPFTHKTLKLYCRPTYFRL